MEKPSLSKPTVEILAVHGWAFASSIWDSWRPFLPDGWQLAAVDRGYFHAPDLNNPRPQLASLCCADNGPASVRAIFSAGLNSTMKILLTHSFGLHCLAAESIEAADLLVIISGFDEFHVSENAPTRRAIRRMLTRLANHDRAVLQDFYQGCFGAAMPLAQLCDWGEGCDFAQLSADLRRLDSGRIETGLLARAKSILILHGQADAIAPVALAHRLCEGSSGRRLLLHPSAGHALPFTDPQWCIGHLQSMIFSLSPALAEVSVS